MTSRIEFTASFPPFSHQPSLNQRSTGTRCAWNKPASLLCCPRESKYDWECWLNAQKQASLAVCCSYPSWLLPHSCQWTSKYLSNVVAVPGEDKFWNPSRATTGGFRVFKWQNFTMPPALSACGAGACYRRYLYCHLLFQSGTPKLPHYEPDCRILEVMASGSSKALGDKAWINYYHFMEGLCQARVKSSSLQWWRNQTRPLSSCHCEDTRSVQPFS